MSTIILKVQLKDEIRRVSLNVTDTFTLAELEAKVVGMFPQLQDFVMQMRNPSTDELQLIYTEKNLSEILDQVRSTHPPILRLCIIEGQTRPQPACAEIVTAPEITLERAELRVHSTDEEEVEEEGDDEEEEEEVEIEMVEIEHEPGSVNSSVDVSEEIAQEPDSVCSFCKSYIGEDSCFQKVRFKCVNCMDVLCDFCEEQEVHDPSHLLVKLRVPVSRLPLKQQIVFVSHIEDQQQRDDARQKRKELRRVLKEERREKRRQERLNAKKARKLARQMERKQRRMERKQQKEQERQLAEAINETEAQLEEFAVAAHVLADAIQSPPEEALPQTEVPEDLPSLEVVIDPMTVSQELPDLVDSARASDEQEEEFYEEEGEYEELNEDEDEDEDEEEEEGEEEEEWNVSSMMEGFQVVTPGEQQAAAAAGTAEATRNLNTLRIKGLALREKLQALEQMGFGDRRRNIYLLVKNFASLEGAVAELVSS